MAERAGNARELALPDATADGEGHAVVDQLQRSSGRVDPLGIGQQRGVAELEDVLTDLEVRAHDLALHVALQAHAQRLAVREGGETQDRIDARLPGPAVVHVGRAGAVALFAVDATRARRIPRPAPRLVRTPKLPAAHMAARTARIPGPHGARPKRWVARLHDRRLVPVRATPAEDEVRVVKPPSGRSFQHGRQHLHAAVGHGRNEHAHAHATDDVAQVIGKRLAVGGQSLLLFFKIIET